MQREKSLQTSLFSEQPLRTPPSTRYQGSKLKLLPWLESHFEQLDFSSVLDAFGGTGSVSYLLKSKGKSVTYNDYLQFNQVTAKALIENKGTVLSEDEVDALFVKEPSRSYDDFISKTFPDTYFTDTENVWLDIVTQNILAIANEFKRSIAFYALFQACIIKRPYNLFHRKNLYMRTAEVDRNFGNKKTWDTPFEEHFRKFVSEANAAIFDSGVECTALGVDAVAVKGKFDLVYIDPPYLNGNGTGVDYRGFYHFLEGMTDYPNWPNRVDWKKKHRPLITEPSPWYRAETILGAFRAVFERFAESTIVVSYRSDGTPSEDQLVGLLREIKGNVRREHYGEYKYVLSTNSTSKEILLIA